VREVTTNHIVKTRSIRRKSKAAWYDLRQRQTMLGWPVAEIPTCKHERTRLIAKDNEAEYIECVDCGAILETRELTEPSKPEPGKSNPFDESLSDA